ncbi:CRISPR-associated protein Cas4 [Tistrella bauzanensis]
MMDETAEAASLPISGLQHWLFCPRQFALIHVERIWAENALTAEGRIAHQAVDRGEAASRGSLRRVTALPLVCHDPPVHGVADVVELTMSDGRGRARRVVAALPVEHKLGRPKAHRADEVQLCAQALALEEMYGITIAEGALFYGRTRRRQAVAFDDELRRLTRRVAAEASACLAAGTTPPAVYDRKRCDACSLVETCRPKALAAARPGRVADWIAARLAGDGGPVADGEGAL